LHRILQQRFAYALAMPTSIHRQARKQHNRHRMTWQPFGETIRRLLAVDLADREGVVADNGAVHHADVGLCRSRLLIRPCVPQ
jgi:hypothetical protein